MVKYLHTMIRISDPEATLDFFKLLGLEEVRRMENAKGRFTLFFLAAPGQKGVAEVELTYNWPPEDGSPPAPRWPHGLHQDARRNFDRAAAGWPPRTAGAVGQHAEHRDLVGRPGNEGCATSDTLPPQINSHAFPAA